jgi:uncharacterized protein YndB with AHSA1/START domain
MMTPGRFTIDQQTHSIRIDRRIRATPDWLFNAWVDPKELRLWWDPSGKPLAICEVDLREGGALKLVNADHPDYAFTGIYRRIERPHRLEFEALGAHGTVTFQALGDMTAMVVEIRCSSAEHLAQFVKMGVADGTAMTVDNLVARAEQGLVS